MNMKREDQVKRVLDSLDGIQRAEAPKEGFSKIQQRLAGQRTLPLREESSGRGWLWIAASLALVLCSNIWVVSTQWTTETAPANVETYSEYPQLITDFNLYDHE
ncbi:hypothetical protein GCM10009119_01620 [Algoriphagus jejuensis]|uniref:DUF3619 family protein n=1 Tax=Algoriphagus jejuensis TaxID=419934 RepID=A0ABP3YAI8_9BACT